VGQWLKYCSANNHQIAGKPPIAVQQEIAGHQPQNIAQITIIPNRRLL